MPGIGGIVITMAHISNGCQSKAPQNQNNKSKKKNKQQQKNNAVIIMLQQHHYGLLYFIPKTSRVKIIITVLITTHPVHVSLRVCTLFLIHGSTTIRPTPCCTAPPPCIEPIHHHNPHTENSHPPDIACISISPPSLSTPSYLFSSGFCWFHLCLPPHTFSPFFGRAQQQQQHQYQQQYIHPL